MNNELETPAGFWIRVLAAMIDGSILGIMNMILSFVLFGQCLNQFYPMGVDRIDFVAFFVSMVRGFILSFLINMSYETVLIGYNGQTVGKLLTRIRVVNVDGTQVTYSKAFARFFSKWLSALTFFTGYLLVAFRKDKRGLHDLIVDTKVIKKWSGTVPIQGQSPQC